MKGKYDKLKSKIPDPSLVRERHEDLRFPIKGSETISHKNMWIYKNRLHTFSKSSVRRKEVDKSLEEHDHGQSIAFEQTAFHRCHCSRYLKERFMLRTNVTVLIQDLWIHSTYWTTNLVSTEKRDYLNRAYHAICGRISSDIR